MSHRKSPPPSSMLRHLLARITPGIAAPAAATLAFMMLAPGAHAADAAAGATLPTVKVEDTTDPMAVNHGYQGTQTRVGKTLQDPQDIPQAITTITRELMEDQQVSSLREALRNVSGLTFNAAEGGRGGDNMMLRGFYTFGDLYLDGIRDTAQYNRETFFLEQVDVLRGSASMLFGRGQAGGVINLVSKTPKRADAYSLTGSVGTDNYTEITADLNKRISENSALRVNLMKRDEGSWRSNPLTGAEPEIDRGGFHVSYAFGMQTDDEFVLSHVQMRNRDIPDYGFSFDNATHRPNTNFSANTFWGIERNFDESDVNVTTGTWTHHFSPKSELRTTVRYGDYERSYWARTPSPTVAPGSTGLNGTSPNVGPTRSMDYETLTVQSDFSTQFRALGMKHELVAGVEYLHEDSHRNTLRNLGGTTALNPPVFDPYVESTASPVNFTGDSYAVYVQDTVEFLPYWKATLGVRRDELKAEYASLTSPQLDFGEWSTRAGVSYQPTDEAHYYLSYSDSFSPTADLYQISGGAQPPERSQVYELGAKWLFFEGDLAFRTALYRADKDYERNTDLEATAAILTRKRRTDGIEFELAGRITPKWEVFSGVSLMKAKILETAVNLDDADADTNPEIADPRFAGQRPRNTPRYTFNLWSTYKLGGGWKIGGGVEVKGDRYGYNPSSESANAQFTTNGQPSGFHPNTAPAYARWDAMAAYEQKDWAVRLNVRNVFDKVYYDAIYDQGPFTVPGTGRQFILTGELKF